METGNKVVELLVSSDTMLANGISREINNFNIERRSVDRSITSEAMKMISEDQRILNSKTTVLYNPNWKKEVIGIVASRLIETYYRQTVILTESNGFATGSARSVQGYDLYQAIEACSDLLESFGGHMFAAGLTMKKENLQQFAERFEQYVKSTITEDQLSPRILVDTELSFAEINEEYFRIISQFQPFGPENMSPVFVFSYNIFDTGSGRMVGSSGEHLKLELCQESSNGKGISGNSFQPGQPFRVYQGREAV